MKQMLKKLSSSQIILLSFLFVILVGTLLLCLPISTKTGASVPFSTALFTATTSTCVTGLVVVPTVSWSYFGQAVILLLIQIGGLGVVTILSALFIALHKTIGLGNRLLLQDAFNLNTLSGLVNFVKKVFWGTFLVEGVGALLYMTVFVPEFGAKGIWISIFNAVSAFCNAGMDIIGENSLNNYVGNGLINFVTMSLIVLGGLGYIVWWDILRASKCAVKNKTGMWRNLTLHSKLVITTTAFLLALGTICFLGFEYHNPKTIANMSFSEKLLASLFQSVTTRTAGFTTLPQENLTTSSSLLSIILMFIGGSPVGTAGGAKTITVAVLFLATLSTIKGKNDVCIFNRAIAKSTISKCVCIVFISLSIALTSTILLSLTTNRPLVDILYEIFSATGTVGLTRNLTPFLNLAGRYIVIVTMFFGRVGPIALAVSFYMKKQNTNLIKEPTEEISVG